MTFRIFGTRIFPLRKLLSATLATATAAACLTGGFATEALATAPGSATTSSKVLAGTRYKPTGRWCPTNRTCLSRIHWISYGGNVARANVAYTDTAGGGTGSHSGQARIQLSAPKRACGRIRFSRLSIRFGRSSPVNFSLMTLSGTCATYN